MIMNLELFILGGYGQFVWSAYVFSFVSCVFLLVKVKKELQRQEKIYLHKYGKLEMTEIKTSEKNRDSKEVLSGSSI